MCQVAEVIAAKTGMPAAAVDSEQLGVFGALLSGDQPASAEQTRQLVDWKPTGPTLLENLEAPTTPTDTCRARAGCSRPGTPTGVRGNQPVGARKVVESAVPSSV
jgi:hypothetical protein